MTINKTLSLIPQSMKPVGKYAHDAFCDDMSLSYEEACVNYLHNNAL
jgi:hypothetical protein